MAARQQPKGTVLGIQYEDLVPKSELKDLPEATLLIIDLPDFAKEQIIVTYVHSSKMIRVSGERPIADRRWSRFNEVFTVPQNCLVDKIHGSFKNNVLTITMPKETITKSTNLPDASKTVDAPLEKVEKQEDEKLLEEAEQKKLLEEREELIKKLQEEAKAKEKSEMMKKLQEEVKAKEKHQEKKLVEEDTVEKKHVDESEGKEKILKPEERKLPEVVYTKPGSGGVGEVVKSAEEKLGYLMEKEKKMRKSIMEKIKGKEITSEEKKLMVNVGVAALVIFALGAYVSYRFCSSSSCSSSSSSPSSSSSTKKE